MKKAKNNTIKIIFLLSIGVIFLTCGTLSYGATIYDSDDCVGYWKFDDGSGDTADDSEGSNDGELTNMDEADWITGKVGGGLNLDGDNDHVRINSSGILSTAGSIALWVNPGSSPVGSSIIVQGSGNKRIYLTYRWDNDLAYRFGVSSEQDTNGNMPLDQWSHAVITWDNGSANAYVNGELAHNHAYTGLDSVEVSNIGSYRDIFDGTSAYFDGLIDKVSIWNKALNTTEINALYKAGDTADALTGAGLGYGTDDINEIANMYALGDDEQAWSPYTASDGRVWSYKTSSEMQALSSLYDSKVVGDGWVENGEYFIKLGGGAQGVPELPPYAMQMVVLLFGVGFGFIKKRFCK